jgi:hypothetical protein
MPTIIEEGMETSNQVCPQPGIQPNTIIAPTINNNTHRSRRRLGLMSGESMGRSVDSLDQTKPFLPQWQ